MRQREEALGFRTEDNPKGLILPLRFQDGEHFPDSARRMSDIDVSDWTVPDPSYAKSAEIADLHRAIGRIAKSLATILQHVPQAREDWPSVELDPAGHPLSTPRMKLTRLK